MKIAYLLALVFSLPAFAQTDTVYKPVEYPAGFTAQLDVVYTKVGDWDGKMDIYLPPKSNGPSPVVINIHGGGWNKGVKESQSGFNSFFKAGFAVANIEYRLSGQATAPAAVEDARCALIYLIKNAKQLNLDVNRIVVMGGSAGGHLALMAGLLGNDHRFDGNCPGIDNIKVAAIIDKYGITDVWDWAYGPNLTSKSATQWLGSKAKDEAFARSVSPMSYVNKNSPPVFIVHGDADPTVPYQESVMLHNKLKELGVRTEFVTIPGGLHGKFTKEQNSELNKQIIAFLTPETLKINKARISNKDATILPAYKQLIKDADAALQFGPVSVMEKNTIPPSGNKHDYMSLAPYFWPDPSKPDGLPYIRKDGQTNPEVRDYKDKEYMPKLCEVVSTLALAYYFSDNPAYAEHASKLMRVWFLDTATRMNPNLNYAQAIKGVNNGRGAGLIDTRHFIKLIDAIGLLQGSKFWKQKDQQGMQQWFSEFLNWMQTSKNGTDEMKTKNNHGAWYDAQRLSMALFIGNTQLAKEIVQNAMDRLDKQMDDSGGFPAEMERTISLHYTVFVMEAFFNIAQMADKVNMDLWNYTSPSGKSLKKGFDVLLPYLLHEKKWEGQQIKDYEDEESYFLLKEGTLRFKCNKCEAGVKMLAADKAPRLRINLLY